MFKVTEPFSYEGFQGYSVEVGDHFGDSIKNRNRLNDYLQNNCPDSNIRVELSGFSNVIRIATNDSKDRLQAILNKYEPENKVTLTEDDLKDLSEDNVLEK